MKSRGMLARAGFATQRFLQHYLFDRHHAVSADFEEKLIAKLGANGVCPHGNDIRGDGAAERRARGLVLLRELKPGTRATIESVFERDRSLLEYFDGRGL